MGNKYNAKSIKLTLDGVEIVGTSVVTYAKPPSNGLSCGCGKPAQKRRQNTNYVDDELNWVVACDPCFDEIEAYWAERWADYYAGCF